jgi:hypothetical protein
VNRRTKELGRRLRGIRTDQYSVRREDAINMIQRALPATSASAANGSPRSVGRWPNRIAKKPIVNSAIPCATRSKWTIARAASASLETPRMFRYAKSANRKTMVRPPKMRAMDT